jgi:hypothetical protein
VEKLRKIRTYANSNLTKHSSSKPLRKKARIKSLEGKNSCGRQAGEGSG